MWNEDTSIIIINHEMCLRKEDCKMKKLNKERSELCIASQGSGSIIPW